MGGQNGERKRKKKKKKGIFKGLNHPIDSNLLNRFPKKIHTGWYLNQRKVLTIQTLASTIITELYLHFMIALCKQKTQHNSSHICLILLNAINDLSSSTFFFYTFILFTNKARFVETFLQLFMHGPLYS